MAMTLLLGKPANSLELAFFIEMPKIKPLSEEIRVWLESFSTFNSISQNAKTLTLQISNTKKNSLSKQGVQVQ
jgi:hypothetical protein